MDNLIYRVDFDGVPVNYQFRCQWTALQFGSFYAVPSEGKIDVMAEEGLISEKKHIFSERTSAHFIEYRLLVEPTGRYLSHFARFFFHSVALCWHGKAWLLTGRSGTGKTTQYMYWQRLWPDEVKIICGDMPLLSLRSDDQIWVNPSPWNGSERYGYGSEVSAPLGGVICLEQAGENMIRAMDLSRYARTLWGRIIGIPDTEDEIRYRESFLNKMLTDVPFWVLENRGDEASAALTRNMLEQYLTEHGD